jgi:hypothetical protein
VQKRVASAVGKGRQEVNSFEKGVLRAVRALQSRSL